MVGGYCEHTGALSFASMYFLSNYFFECPLTALGDSLANSIVFLLPVLSMMGLVSQSPEVPQVPALGVN